MLNKEEIDTILDALVARHGDSDARPFVHVYGLVCKLIKIKEQL
jgi:hypothetical protein